MVPRTVGGIRKLCELVDEFGDAVEADFQQFYNLDLSGVWRGETPPRRALALAEQLATIPNSRLRALSLGDVANVGWGRAEWILADLYDALTDNSVVTVKAAGGKASRPSPYPRPDVPDVRAAEEVRVPTIEDFPIQMVVAMTAFQQPKK